MPRARSNPYQSPETSEGLPVEGDHRTRQLKKRPRLLTAICVFAVAVGVWDAWGIASAFSPGEDPLTERQRQTVQQIKGILDPWQPVATALFVLNSIKGILLVVVGISAFRLYPWARKHLLIALSFAVLVDALGLVWFLGATAATFEINVQHMIGTIERLMRAPPGPDTTRMIAAFAVVAVTSLILLKIGLETAACKYLRSPTVQLLYNHDGRQRPT